MIEKLIIHMMDPSSNLLICADQEAQLEESCIEMLKQKMTKAFTSAKKSKGHLREDHTIAQWIGAYRNHEQTFVEMSRQIAQDIYEKKCKAAQFEPSDLMIAEVLFEERRYLVGMDHTYVDGWIHESDQSEMITTNAIRKCTTLVSNNLLKNDRVFLLEYSDQTLFCIETKIEIDAEPCYFYSDIVFQSKNTPSYQDVRKAMNKAVEDTIKEYDLDSVKVLPKMKQMMQDTLEANEVIKVSDVASIVFGDQPLAKQHFETEMKEKGMDRPILTEYVKPTKAEKVTKIKTDKGIEVIIPINYMDSTEYVEFQTLEDGTLMIHLKNINRITSK